MSDVKNDSWPAFPIIETTSKELITPGLSKREYLIASLLQGSAYILYKNYGNNSANIFDAAHSVVRVANFIADAVEARKS